MEYPKVSDYMTEEVITLNTSDHINKFYEKLKNTGHTGYPVVDGEGITGYITAKDILLTDSEMINQVEYDDRPYLNPDQSIQNASNIMFRYGYHELPVTSNENEIVGILSNMDIIRSQIQKTHIDEVNKYVKTYERLYNTECEYKKESVELSKLNPTQDKVYQDRLNARKYEIKNDLVEPIVVIKTKSDHVLLDGHHRLIAAIDENINELTAYVINVDVETIDILENSRRNGLKSYSDIEIKKY